jgi:hypothetical protein
MAGVSRVAGTAAVDRGEGEELLHDDKARATNSPTSQGRLNERKRIRKRGAMRDRKSLSDSGRGPLSMLCAIGTSIPQRLGRDPSG